MSELTKKLENELSQYKRLYALDEQNHVVTAKSGQRVNTRTHKGYLYIGFRLYHRVVFGLFNNYLADKIDHKDRNRLNNRPDNLRECSSFQSILNRGVSKGNKLGIKGVCIDMRQPKKPFRAYFAGYSVWCEKITDAMGVHDALCLAHDKTFAVTHISGLKKAFFVDYLYHHPEGKGLRAEILAETSKYTNTAA